MPFTYFICTFFFLFSSFSLANSYSLGSLKCKNFQEVKTFLINNPKSLTINFEYATCLIAKGEKDDGLKRLRWLVDKKNHVWSAYTIARYIESAETFDTANILDIDVISAIKAFSHVLSLIHDLDLYYPGEYEKIEQTLQIELNSYASLPNLYLSKSFKGLTGDLNEYILASPSFDGSEDLKSFPKYSSHTLDSLNQAIQTADDCLKLPKKWYFRSVLYTNTKKACQIYKEGAQALIPLEQKRQKLLIQESCKKDILKCEKLKQLALKMRAIYSNTQNEASKTFRLQL